MELEFQKILRSMSSTQFECFLLMISEAQTRQCAPCPATPFADRAAGTEKPVAAQPQEPTAQM